MKTILIFSLSRLLERFRFEHFRFEQSNIEILSVLMFFLSQLEIN